MAGISRYDYREDRMRADQGGEKALLKWILGVVSTLLIAAIIGAVQLAIQVAELRTSLENLQRQVDRIEQRIEPAYRGSGGRESHASPIT